MTPEIGEGTSMVAFSVSSSNSGWSLEIVSPAETRILVRSPESTFSPSSGSLMVVVTAGVLCEILALRNHLINFGRINLHLLDGFLHDRWFDNLLPGEFIQSGQSDEARVHLKKISQGGPSVAAPKTVGSQRDQGTRHPARDRIRQSPHIIGCGNQRARSASETVGYVRSVGLFGRVEHIPAVAGVAVLIKLLVAGNAPDIRRDAVVLRQHFLCVQRLAKNRAASQKLCAKLRVLILRRR